MSRDQLVTHQMKETEVVLEYREDLFVCLSNYYFTLRKHLMSRFIAVFSKRVHDFFFSLGRKGDDDGIHCTLNIDQNMIR